MTDIIKFDFEGDELDVVRLPDGDVGVSLRRMCDGLGIDAEGQRQRLARHVTNGARWAWTCVVQVQVDGQGRATVMLPRRSIPMWAATVDASRVAEAVRPKLIAYQDRCADVLADAFGVGDGRTRDTASHARLTLLSELQLAEGAGDRRTVCKLATCLADLAREPRPSRRSVPETTSVDTINRGGFGNIAPPQRPEPPGMTTEAFRAAVAKWGGQNRAALLLGYSRATVHNCFAGAAMSPAFAARVRAVLEDPSTPPPPAFSPREAGRLGGRPRVPTAMEPIEVRVHIVAARAGSGDLLGALKAKGVVTTEASLLRYAKGQRPCPSDVADALRAIVAEVGRTAEVAEVLAGGPKTITAA